jgi:AcrR family transcriptional regulator
VRNREKLLEAATEIFGSGDQQATLEGVARRAGVGIGTLYRHFPTREALFEAVYRHEVEHLAALAEELVTHEDPVEGVRLWLHANVRLMSTKKGMVAALQLASFGSSELKAYSTARMAGAMGILINRAVAAGKIRDDVSPEDLMRAAVGIFYSQSSAEWQATALRLVDIIVDGLRRSSD